MLNGTLLAVRGSESPVLGSIYRGVSLLKRTGAQDASTVVAVGFALSAEQVFRDPNLRPP
jgi:hypothetical protein